MKYDREKRKEKYLKHREKIREKQHEYYEKNKPRIRDMQKEYYEKNKRQIYERNKNNNIVWQQKRRLKCLHHYSNDEMKCAICGITDMDVLVIDHIDGGGTRHAKERGTYTSHLYAYLIENNFPEGYRVLCHNCNWKEARRLKLIGRKATDVQMEKLGLKNKNKKLDV
jgi:hypothetical protein